MEHIEVKGVKVPFLRLFDACGLVSIKLVWQASGVCEDGVVGETNFAAKVLEEGVFGREDFHKELEKRAIELNVNYDFETFKVELVALKEFAGFALNSLAELLQKPNLKEEIFDKVRRNVISNIKLKRLNFGKLSQKKLKEMVFEGNLAKEFLGTEAEVERFGEAEARSVLSRLDLANLHVSASGEMESETLKTLEKTLANLPKGERRVLGKFALKSTREVRRFKEETTQSFISFAAPLCVSEEEHHLRALAFYILGAGGFGSRLMEEIRVRRGLAYSVGGRSVWHKSYQLFRGALQTKNESAEEAMAATREIVRAFVEGGVSEFELESAKKSLCGSEVLANENIFSRASLRESGYYNFGDEEAFAKRFKKIASANLDELNAFVKRQICLNELGFVAVCG